MQVTDNDTLSLIDAGAMVVVGGALLVRATFTKDSETKAKGDVTSPFVALGASLGLGIGLDTARARVDGTAG